MRLPNFIIVGGTKCGTTATIHNLSLSANICTKAIHPSHEIHFFDKYFDLGVNWYSKLFEACPTNCIVGEKTANYLGNPITLRRIKGVVPHAKLIVLLRHPSHRFWSFIQMLIRRGSLDCSHLQWLRNTRPEWFKNLLRKGFYVDQLNDLFSLFPREQIYIGITEKIRTNTLDETNKILSFLEAELLPDDITLSIEQETFLRLQPRDEQWLNEFYRDKNKQLFGLLGYRICEWTEPNEKTIAFL